MSECPRGPRTLRPQKTSVRADPTTPPGLLLSHPAHGPLSHSLPAIAAVSLVRAPYGLCLGKDVFPARGIAPCAFPSCSFCKAACPRGGREVGKGVAGLITEPFRCQEFFPASPQTLPLVCLGKPCVGRRFVRAVRTLISLLCSSGNTINCLWQEAPGLLGAVNLYSRHGKRHVLCWARAPTVPVAATQE